ncbi:hypothetical protein PROFUN_04229 [Planoprotostelium fungivorum]|uniref:Secreted protein n=1 Tax=Planoprotostelium fungivorum TaxID=1890364 RepID=A0A2P6NW88_9EUKA|nr:hypothetical protein PROFUN_04229 [Planoprotostelium fungivorum]
MRTFLLIALTITLVSGWNLRVVNNVAPCAGRNYATIKLFTSDNAQHLVNRGQSYTVDGSKVGFLGLGIQENGMYCRSNGWENGCINPDNAGMQLVVNQGNCRSYSLNNPFYCGAHPPNAKGVVNVAMSGNWPNCVATLTRKGNAPGCNSRC